jgi:ADP-heptose:LPS heptosyltransferase
LAAEIAVRAGLPGNAVLAGQTDLPTLAATIAAAGRVACSDTGVAHLATAFGTPSVVVFGPTPPARWGPPPGRAHHVALWSGRIGDPHGTEPDPGLLEVGVGDVTAALEGLPDRETIRNS